MGINAASLRLLLHAKTTGVDFSRTATISRLGLHVPLKKFVSIIKDEFGHGVSEGALKKIHAANYVEPLLEYLGAKEVVSFDYSDYEKSTHKHNLNVPIPEEFKSGYTAVIEGGTLEHVFNFPVAVKNCMQMVKVGGHFLGATPSNSYMGHGFYQFSPELFFRVFGPENGFRIEHMFLVEGRASKRWLSVPDPQVVHHRVGMRSSTQTLLLIRALRVSECDIFSTTPLQSDYVSRWAGGKKIKAKDAEAKGIARLIRYVSGRGHIPPYLTPFNAARTDTAAPAVKC